MFYPDTSKPILMDEIVIEISSSQFPTKYSVVLPKQILSSSPINVGPKDFVDQVVAEYELVRALSPVHGLYRFVGVEIRKW